MVPASLSVFVAQRNLPTPSGMYVSFYHRWQQTIRTRACTVKTSSKILRTHIVTINYLVIVRVRNYFCFASHIRAIMHDLRLVYPPVSPTAYKGLPYDTQRLRILTVYPHRISSQAAPLPTHAFSSMACAILCWSSTAFRFARLFAIFSVCAA